MPPVQKTAVLRDRQHAVQLGTELELQNRSYIVSRPFYGADWSDLAHDICIEREGIIEH